MTAEAPDGRATSVLAELAARGQTLSVAESLTGGMLASALTDVPGASAVFRGAVVAYATDLKVELLGVSADTVAESGVVSPEVAVAMAEGVRERLGSTYSLGTTGVAGPDRQEDKPAGTVYVAVAGPAGSRAAALSLEGDRHQVRRGTCVAALDVLGRTLDESGTAGRS